MSMDQPLVSVHIITYNQEAYIARAIEGALQQQTSFGVEIIVGDDCSTDGTRDVVLRYQHAHPERLRVITSDRNGGAFENSQRVLQICRGRYVAYCDGDDYWTDPHKLQKQVDFLEAHPEYSLCCHDVAVVCDGVPRFATFVEFPGDTFSFDDAVRGHFIPTASLVSRREAAFLPPWLKECVSVDLFVELLMLDRGLGRYIHETMAVKVDNAGSISLTPETRMRRMGCFLRMYRNVDLYTEGRHRDILRWKIARLTLSLAHENLKVMCLPSFFRYVLDSLTQDPGAAWEAFKRRLCLLRGVYP